MTQPAVLHPNTERNCSHYLRLGGKPSSEPPYPWKAWVRQVFLAILLNKKCVPKFVLSDPSPVFDQPPPKPETIPPTEPQTKTDKRIARN